MNVVQMPSKIDKGGVREEEEETWEASGDDGVTIGE